MNLKYCADYNEMSQSAYESIIIDLKEHPSQLICTATGNSPTGIYERLTRHFDKHPECFKDLSIIKLDEWGGIDSKEPSSCESYIQEKLVQPLRIPRARYIAFDSNPVSPEEECRRIQSEIEHKGPIDICVLGIGQNGHIGFNEPADSLIPYSHLAKLAPESLNHQMINELGGKPSYGRYTTIQENNPMYYGSAQKGGHSKIPLQKNLDLVTRFFPMAAFECDMLYRFQGYLRIG